MLTRCFKAIIALHVLLYFTDNLPILHTSFSILCHLVYLQNFSETWPLIDLTSIPFVASCILVISDHFIWFYYFARLTSEARRLRTYRGAVPYAPGFTEIAAFFGLCVWLSPLFLFLSLSANDNALPIMSAGKRMSCSLMLMLLTALFQSNLHLDPHSVLLPRPRIGVVFP